MKAFWTIRPSIQDESGAWMPSFPAGFQSAWQNNCDIRILPAGAAPADHKHAVSGAIALGSNHGHYVFYYGVDSVYQEYFGGGTAHDHAETINPDYYAVFVVCSDAQYAQLLINAPNIIILGECAVDADEIGAVNNTAWDASERTGWENKFDNFGVDLPDIVTNDRRLVQFVLTMFHAPTQKMLDERNYRYGSYEIAE